MQISNQLKKARKDKKLTQEYVASQINVSRKTISSWENGHGQPNSAYLKQLNSIYDTHLQLHYTQNNHRYNDKYFNLFYSINLLLFVLCLINLFIGLFSGIAALQLIFISFFFIYYRINILVELKNERKYIYVFFCVIIILFIITMNNLEYIYFFSNIFKDLPFFIGAIIHSLILTASFFIITNYRKGK
ncbi:helix-turn-helix transcriptional regulator [Apilactobacillus timberlakei]|uniref:helix-turn-helix transcriptional regulator n=1 Tax=Apilactobacillus timberlakei TaxID=2008380 RepID=UPI00112BBE61|nr:helix-turn-helix transcriptional regulator [Apilactobacillus timberlakei]TPR20619.1 XRE family transcriptional regulator [Apilactobacillus timberlakei]TPR22662.1 XRE family transcriptional regulator [Apilactobacillus timberlakei]